MRRIDFQLAKQARSSIRIVALLLVPIIGYVDWLTGSDVSLSLFYLAPIALMAGYVSRTEGFFIALACGAVWLLADLARWSAAPRSWIPYFNVAVRTAVFAIVAWLVARTKELNAGLETRVKQRTAELEQEIAERTRVEAQLRASEGLFRQLTNSITQVFWMTDVDKTEMLYISPGYEKIWGRTCASLYQSPKSWFEAIHPDDQERIHVAALTQQVGGTFDEEYCVLRPNGGFRWVRDRAFPIYDQTGKVYRIAGIAEDITKRRELEQQILEISDREQARIGQDLHDGLCQELVGIAFAANVLSKRLASQSSSESAGACEIAGLLKDAISHCRNVARGLYPVKMDAAGLSSALEELASMMTKRFQIPCVFEPSNPVVLTDDAVNTHVYRIAQEAVINAIKHAQPGRVQIGLSAVGDTIKLTVTDNGVGLQKGALRSGLGLHIMEYRARLIGGALALRRGPNGGTRVECSFPSRIGFDRGR